MKLYRARVPIIASQAIERLSADGDIDVPSENREEAEADLVAIMEEFVRRDIEFRNRIRDYMAHRNIPYDKYGRIRQKMSEDTGHPLGDDVERFLCRQFIEALLISRFVDEVYGEDKDMYPKIMEVLRGNDVDEREIRAEAIEKIKNVREGTVDYEIALRDAMRDVKKRRGLL